MFSLELEYSASVQTAFTKALAFIVSALLTFLHFQKTKSNIKPNIFPFFF